MYIDQPSHSFLDLTTMNIRPNIWEDINGGLWKSFNITSWLANNLLTPNQIAQQQPLFPNLLQILPGTYWNDEYKQLEPTYYTPNKCQCSLNEFISESEKFFKNLGAKRIGVHLSGGLDSSIIMALLHYLGIPFVPIGLQSSTFEFRTEKYIQEILLQWGEDGCLLRMDDYPFFSDLTKFPASQIPSEIFKSSSGIKALVSKFESKGCDVVLSGQGGDTLFVDEVRSIENLRFNIDDEFINHDEAELFYAPHNIRLISFFAHKPIINIISNARIGQHLDPLKRWARNWLKDFLPRELVEYRYCANFQAMTMWGLEQAKPTIKLLMEQAGDYFKHQMFDSNNIAHFIDQDVFAFEPKEYINFCGSIAIAVWVNSIINYE